MNAAFSITPTSFRSHLTGTVFSHDRSPAGRRQALLDLQDEASRASTALQARAITELGRPLTPQEARQGRFDPPDTRGPHEKQCDELARTAAFNVYQARLDILRAQGIATKEIEALTIKAAAFVPATPPPAEAPVSPYDVAIQSLTAKPGHTPAERAATARQIAHLRDANAKWQAEQEREVQAKARDADPLRINAIENAEAGLRASQLLPNVPQSHVNGCAERLQALRDSTDADGGVAAYWAGERKAAAELDAHFERIEKQFDEKKATLLSDRKAALSRLPVEPPAATPAPPKSAIETTLAPNDPPEQEAQ
jgi:hypothetical protein